MSGLRISEICGSPETQKTILSWSEPKKHSIPSQAPDQTRTTFDGQTDTRWASMWAPCPAAFKAHRFSLYVREGMRIGMSPRTIPFPWFPFENPYLVPLFGPQNRFFQPPGLVIYRVHQLVSGRSWAEVSGWPEAIGITSSPFSCSMFSSSWWSRFILGEIQPLFWCGFPKRAETLKG